MWSDTTFDRSAQQAKKRKAILRAAAMVFTRQGSHPTPALSTHLDGFTRRPLTPNDQMKDSHAL